MWRVNSVVLLLPLMFEDSFQGSALPGSYESNPKPQPKTFTGRTVCNTTQSLNASICQLSVSENIFNYTTGIVSTRIIPFFIFWQSLLGSPPMFLCWSASVEKLSSGILYFSLAVSDLLLLVSLTLRVHYHLNNNDWVFGELACKLVTACFYGNIYCSVHAHMCISMMRYFAVVHPFMYRGLSRRHCAIWASLTVWVVFAAVMTPEFLVQQTYQVFGQETIMCHDIQPYAEQSYIALIPYRLSLICLGFILPSLVITFAYGSIIHHLNLSSCDCKQYIKASTLVFGIFLVCFTPSSVIHFVHYVMLYTQNQEELYHYYRVAVCLCSFHSCLDPFLSYVLTKMSTSQPKFISFSSSVLKAASII